MCEDDFGNFDWVAFDEALARFRRGELAEGLIWLGRVMPELEIVETLYRKELGQATLAARLKSAPRTGAYA